MTRLVSSFVPGVELRQQFTQNTAAGVQSLSAFIFGGHAQILRASDRQNSLLGQYNPVGQLIEGAFQTAYSWPNRATGAEIDASFTAIEIEDALLQYWNIAAGTMIFDGRNKIRHPSLNFATNGAFAAGSVFGDRGVRVGDPVLVRGDDNGTPFTLATYVQGFDFLLSTPTVGAPVEADANHAAILAAVSTVTPALANTTTSVGTATGYDGFASGNLIETYRVEVVRASTGGDGTTARFKVTTASGKDDRLLVTPAAFGSPTAIGTRGLQLTLTAGDDLYLGDVFTINVATEYTPPMIAITGAYSPATRVDRNYLVEIVSGDSVGSDILVRLSTTTGTDDSRIVALTDTGGGVMAPLALGSYGLSITFNIAEGLRTGDKWTVSAVAAKPTNARTLLLAHNLPSGVVQSNAAALDVTLYIRTNATLPIRSQVAGQFNYTSRPTELLVAAGVALSYPSWTFSGVTEALPLVSPPEMGSTFSRMYVTYRAWLPQSTAILSGSDPADLDTLLSGENSPDNPLKYGLGKAFLANAGAPVFFFAVGNPDEPSSWTAALQAVDDTTLTYGFVPLTRNTAALDAVYGHVQSRRGPAFNLFRVCWVTGDDITSATIATDELSTDGQPIMATIEADTNAASLPFTLLTITSGNFPLAARGIRAGDVLRFGFATDLWGDRTFDSYVVDSVVNESTLLLRSGSPFAESVPRKVEIYRTLSTQERALAIQNRLEIPRTAVSTNVTSGDVVARYPGLFTRFLPFGTMIDGTVEVPSYFAAAVLAAARSALAPQQGMTRMAVPGFTAIKDSGLFSTTELNEIAASGGFILSSDILSGRLVVRHAVTAGDFDNVNTREESIVSNVDSVSFYLFQVLNPYIGRANVTDLTIAQIRGDIMAASAFLQSANAIGSLGGQIIDLQIIDIRQSPISKDTILVSVSVLVPGPVNRIRVDLFVV